LLSLSSFMVMSETVLWSQTVIYLLMLFSI
jgi:hypothetical protein